MHRLDTDIFRTWLPIKGPIRLLWRLVVQRYPVYLKFLSGSTIAVLLFFSFFKKPYEAKWELNSANGTKNELVPDQTSTDQARPLIFNEVIQQSIKQLNLRVSYWQSELFWNREISADESPVIVSLLDGDAAKSLTFKIDISGKNSYVVYYNGWHYVFKYQSVPMLNRCRLSVRTTGNQYQLGHFVNVRIDDLGSVTSRMNESLTVTPEESANRFLVKVSGDNPSSVFAIANNLRQVYTECQLRLQLGVDSDIAGQVTKLARELQLLNSTTRIPARDLSVVHQKQSVDLKIYFALLQKQLNFNQKLVIANELNKRSAISVVRVSRFWTCLLYVLLIGGSGATLYIMLKNPANNHS